MQIYNENNFIFFGEGGISKNYVLRRDATEKETRGKCVGECENSFCIEKFVEKFLKNIYRI